VLWQYNVVHYIRFQTHCKAVKITFHITLAYEFMVLHGTQPLLLGPTAVSASEMTSVALVWR